MNREYLYANWRGGNALLGRVAAMVKVGTTRANLTSQWPHAFLSGIFFYKSLLNPPPIILGLLHPPTMKPSVLPPKLSKTVYFTPGRFFSGGFATVTTGLLQ